MSDLTRPAAHLSNKDFDFFYRGLAAASLLIQKCRECGSLRNPPGPMCPRCGSLEWTTIKSSGAGAIYSYTIHYHPPLPGFNAPHPVVLVELEEGVRMLGGIRDVILENICIGMAVTTTFGKHNDLDCFWFIPRTLGVQA